MQARLRLTGALLALALVGAARPAAAQDLEVRLHGGIIQPLAATSDYFELGPSVAVEALYPLSDALGVTVDLGWDYLNAPDVHPTPTTNLWRSRVGLEANLMGQDGDQLRVNGLLGAGATMVKSHVFWLASRQPYTFEGENINETVLTASGGLRFGLATSDDIQWWLTARVNWQPISEINQDALQELSRDQLDPLGSQTTLAITLGVNLW